MATTRTQFLDENTTRQPAAVKNFYQKPVIKPRAALSSISTNVEREPAFKNAKKGPYKQQVLPAPPPLKPESPPEMEVDTVADQLSQQLYIDDIDAIESDNPQLCAEYVKEIYVYMMKLEKQFHVSPTYFTRQPSINLRMRTILIDWLIQVHQRFNLLQETLYLTISIIDRYLELVKVGKNELQLVGVTAMLLASKYEEMYAPEVQDFVFITDDSFSGDQIRTLERKMLKVLDYSFGTPLCLHFLRRYSRAGEVTPQIHTMAKFLMELCLPEYSMLEFTPSKTAAAALYIAKLVFGSPGWTHTLHHYTTYTEMDILPCACKIAKLVQNMEKAKQQAVRNKYASSKFMSTSKVPGLFSEEMQALASRAS